MNVQQTLGALVPPTPYRDWLVVGDMIPHTTFRITGFGLKYLPLEGWTFKHAGVYIDFCLAQVHNIANGCTQSVQLSKDMLRGTRYEPLHETIDAYLCRVSDLPSTFVLPGDLVQEEGGPRLLVRKVAYAEQDILSQYPPIWCDEECPSGIWVPCTKSHTQSMHKLRVIERGNLFRFTYGQPINVSSLEEEAHFYQELGFSHKVTHANGSDTCTIAEAIALLENGSASDIKITDKKRALCTVIVYDVPGDFSKRLRDDTLRRFGIRI